MESSIKNKIDNIHVLLADLPEVEFAYLFGSRVSGQSGALSDIDIAVYVDVQEGRLLYRLKLLERLQRLMGFLPVDLVVLNDAPPVLKYEVIKYGRVLKENKDARVMFETMTLSEYLDTEHLRNTQRMYLKDQLLQGEKHG